MVQFELWVEGSNLWGQQVVKARLLKEVVEGEDFVDAVDKYIDTLPKSQAAHWEFDDDEHVWRWCGRRVFDNATAAKAIYG